MSERPSGGADEIGTSGLVGGESYHEGGRIDQGHVGGDRRPAAQRRALQAERTEQAEDAAKEALDGAALAQLVSGPGGWQAGAIRLPLGISGDECDGAEQGVGPRN